MTQNYPRSEELTHPFAGSHVSQKSTMEGRAGALARGAMRGVGRGRTVDAGGAGTRLHRDQHGGGRAGETGIFISCRQW